MTRLLIVEEVAVVAQHEGRHLSAVAILCLELVGQRVQFYLHLTIIIIWFRGDCGGDREGRKKIGSGSFVSDEYFRHYLYMLSILRQIDSIIRKSSALHPYSSTYSLSHAPVLLTAYSDSHY